MVSEGAKRAIDGHWCVFYGGYWIKAYDAPADTLLAKKGLIQALTRRLFNHVEHGLNIPGTRLDEARRAFDAETDPPKKRVKGAMLAGALFNRATDVITKAVELQALGIEIRAHDALMRQCGDHLQEALALGRLVLHRSGEEGIDELWGEPFKAFVFPIEDFYRSRYIKIAATMRQIDAICDRLAADVHRRADVRGPRAPHRGVRARRQDQVRNASHRLGDLRGLVLVRVCRRDAVRVPAAALAAAVARRTAACVAGHYAHRRRQGSRSRTSPGPACPCPRAPASSSSAWIAIASPGPRGRRIDPGRSRCRPGWWVIRGAGRGRRTASPPSRGLLKAGCRPASGPEEPSSAKEASLAPR